MPTTPTDDLLLKMHAALRAYYNGVGTWAAYEQAKEALQATEHSQDNGQRVLVQTGEDTIDFLDTGIEGIRGVRRDNASLLP